MIIEDLMKKLVIIFFMLILFSSCSRNDQILIGHISPLTGENARWGIWERDGIELAVEQINQGGGINGRTIRVIHEDSQGDPKVAISALQKLINQDVQAVIGATLSGTTLACAPIAEENKVVLMTPSAQSPKISAAGEYIFRIFASNVVEGTKIVELSSKFDIEKAGILYANTEYGVGLYSVVSQQLENKGVSVTVGQAYNPDNKDYRSQLSKIKEVNCDAIFLFGFPKDMANILRQMKELGINSLIFAPNSFEEQEIIDLSQGAAEGVYYAYPVLDSLKRAKEIMQSFSDKYGDRMNYYNGVGYDATMIFINALKESLKQYDEVRGEYIKNVLYKMKEYNGVTGPISFDSNGDVKDRKMEFRRVQNGKFIRIEN